MRSGEGNFAQMAQAVTMSGPRDVSKRDVLVAIIPAHDVAEPGAEHAGQGPGLPEALAHVVSRGVPRERRRAGARAGPAAMLTAER